MENLTIEPGTIIGIVGKEGAGKSTLVKVLLNRLSATKGKVLVGSTENGRVEVSSVAPAEFERHAKTFMQDFVPPEGKSIRQLLELAQTSAPPGGITMEEACELTGLYEFLPKRADALDTVLGASWDQGQNFSGGQMKQIGLAMVLVSNPEVMVLDEPFANISSATADTILAKICEHVQSKNKTLIVISHNYGSFSHADKLLTIEKGCVTQYGRPSEIAHQDGAYLEGILDMVNPALRPLDYQLRYKKGVGLEMYRV